MCEIMAWCPVETDPIEYLYIKLIKYDKNYFFSNMQNLILNTRSYTIFIKNDVEFRKFNKKE
jgi:hypothetical protein